MHRNLRVLLDCISIYLALFLLKRMTTKEYRGRYAIIARMLGTINESGIEGISKTSIMYKSFLSYAQLKEYLSFLLEKGLIDEFPQQTEASGNEKSLYKITEKGLRLLQISQEIESLIGLDWLLMV